MRGGRPGAGSSREHCEALPGRVRLHHDGQSARPATAAKPRDRDRWVQRIPPPGVPLQHRRHRVAVLGAPQDLGRHQEAADLHQQTLTLRERVLGPDHPDTLAIRNPQSAIRNSLARTAGRRRWGGIRRRRNE
ncbi:tetratricopeptide repeat protein [Streptomyces nojiriensis]|uniref:tetratricopeptide repeat protein n=1 Tax=Streptomyces nojiriensis TaxID=66374 RepID=UPI003652EFCB